VRRCTCILLLAAILPLAGCAAESGTDLAFSEVRAESHQQVVAEPTIRFENRSGRSLRVSIARLEPMTSEYVLDGEVQVTEVPFSQGPVDAQPILAGDYLLTVVEHRDDQPWPFERVAVASLREEELGDDLEVVVRAEREALHLFVGDREKVYPYLRRPEILERLE
jgi:hypothetical protein